MGSAGRSALSFIALATLVACVACRRSRTDAPAVVTVGGPRDVALADAGAAGDAFALADGDAANDTKANPFARFSRACGAPLPAGVTLEKAPDTLVAEALLPSYDRATNRLAFVTEEEVRIGVSDCRGHVSWSWDRPELTPRLVPGEYEMDRQTVAPHRQAVWITTGVMRGLCDSPMGFRALVVERAGKIEVEGIGLWEDMCGGPGNAKLITFGANPPIDALLTANTAGTDEPGGMQGTDVYVARGGDLVLVGYVTQSYSENPFFPIEHGWAKSMWAPLRGDPSGIVAEETWTFEPHGLAGAKKHTAKITRVYAMRGDKLVTTPPWRDPEP
jgi:hypothetical protein